MSKERIRVNFFISPSDGFLYEEILKADAKDRSDTIRRLAQSGALLERMIGAGLQGEVMVEASKQGGAGKDREKTIPLQSSKGGNAKENRKNTRDEVKPAEPKPESEVKVETGFGDLPLDDQFLQ